jgi:hypothetical protein
MSVKIGQEKVKLVLISVKNNNDEARETLTEIQIDVIIDLARIQERFPDRDPQVHIVVIEIVVVILVMTILEILVAQMIPILFLAGMEMSLLYRL